MQGRVLGAYTSLQSIARIIGPMLAVSAYMHWRGLLYALEAVLGIFVLVMHILAHPAIKVHKKKN
jgi:MFS family permease